ncbi:penicillin acylase family protein [Phenylobacterium immobile]|uniref:penicillin acylase family protein n=1 Tax=Phenylobacterium immobile TaxID=21 RepID=UPI000A6762D0|nr:penicillin acylase family protein [Phenylobacterium immobile]
MVQLRTALTAAALIAAASQATAQPLPPAKIASPVKGLEKPAEIRIDRWGVAHIYAASIRDAFFLQGYNVARDRLWQIDLWRKRGLGLLSADFGPAYVEQDRAARLLLYRGDMAAEWAAYGPAAQGQASAFVGGVNAYVAEIRAGKQPLPAEFKLAGTTPSPWSAEDVVRIRSHALSRNAPTEVRRAQIACVAGINAAKLFRNIEPKWDPTLPSGLDPCDVPGDVLTDYTRGTQGVRFDPATRKLALLDAPDDIQGSNNWAIAGQRTATGRPILASDPHREHSAPSLRYVVHMEAPGLSVIGAGEPALPGVSIGHNDKIAFGLTIFPADQEDLYVYELKSAAPRTYRYQGKWEDMKVIREAIPVRGEAPRMVDLVFTRHGPVLKTDPVRGRAFALRSVWWEPGTAAYFGSSGYMQSANYAEFKTALERWGAPSVNQVFADVSGAIGWVASAKTPARTNWDGLTPVPGDGRYEWKGMIAPTDLPSEESPARGWIATANQMNLPDGYPYDARRIGFEWTNGSRKARISEVLADKGKSTLADSMALQIDPTDVQARRMNAVLRGVRTRDDKLKAAVALLRRWDGRSTTDSAAAALYQVWITNHLGAAIVARAVPERAQRLVGQGDLAAVMLLLENPDETLPRAARDVALLESLGAAYDEVVRRLGPDPRGWTWGALHQARFEHALTPLVSAAQKDALSSGTAPMAGGAYSPLAASYRPSDYRVIAGASFRMVVDVGQWDDSRFINTPGQSGSPGSAHFRDLFPLWAKGEYAPLVFTRAAVEAATETTLKLTPAVEPVAAPARTRPGKRRSRR